MLLVQRDAYGWIHGAISVFLVDKVGQRSLTGEYLYVEQLELSHGVNSRHVIHEFIHQIAEMFPTAHWGYWERRDRPRKQLRLYARTQLCKEEVRV